MVESIKQIVERLFSRDRSLWSLNHDAPLGWLDSVEFIEKNAKQLMQWASSLVHERDIEKIVLIGMGGSNLAAEVIYSVFGRQPNYPELVILDTTSPSALRQLEINNQTLFIVSSKSGSTIETRDLHSWLYMRANQLSGSASDRFIAITDANSQLANLAEIEGFHDLFLNPPDIVGRFSALSFFSLVPAALLGIDIRGLGKRLKQWWSTIHPRQSSELYDLIDVMSECSKTGYGLLGIDLPESLQPLFLWIEQLVAESTGKQGKGILPVDPNRMNHHALSANKFKVVSIRMNTLQEQAQINDRPDSSLVLSMQDEYDLAGMFMLWMSATAVVASQLAINAFDQPDVEAAKIETLRAVQNNQLINQQHPPHKENNGISDLTIRVGVQSPDAIRKILKDFYANAKPDGYLAILAFLPVDKQIDDSLKKLADAFKSHFAAVTIGFGPRYLHSTGQLHKGGPKMGWFLQIVEDDAVEIDVPGRDYEFNRLHRAQADGDFKVLENINRPVLRILIGDDRLGELERLAKVLA